MVVSNLQQQIQKTQARLCLKEFKIKGLWLKVLFQTFAEILVFLSEK